MVSTISRSLQRNGHLAISPLHTPNGAILCVGGGLHTIQMCLSSGLQWS